MILVIPEEFLVQKLGQDALRRKLRAKWWHLDLKSSALPGPCLLGCLISDLLLYFVLRFNDWLHEALSDELLKVFTVSWKTVRNEFLLKEGQIGFVHHEELQHLKFKLIY